VSLEQTIDGFESILKGWLHLKWWLIVCFLGELDHIPEVAFYMQGAIDDVHKKAEELAKLWTMNDISWKLRRVL
jgi:F0F1-type ATP synthase beta subunit